MALIRCPECLHEVSDNADKCPNCGFPVSTVKQFVPMPKHDCRFRGLIERGKTYYFADDDRMEEIYGAEQPVCLSEHDLWEIADGWGVELEELMEQVHEASDAEIIKFGVIH